MGIEVVVSCEVNLDLVFNSHHIIFVNTGRLLYLLLYTQSAFIMESL
jgi:hypothetical protein